MVSFPAWFDPGLCERFTLTLLHFLWQGTLIAICAAMLNRLLHHATSHRRYLVNVTALIAMACCLPVTFFRVSVPTSGALRAAPVEAELSQVSPRTEQPTSMPELHLLPTAGGVFGDGSVQTGTSSVAPMPPQLSGYSAESQETKDEVSSEFVTQKLLRSCAPYVMVVYLIGVFGLVVCHVRGAWLGRQLIRTSTVVTEPELLSRLQTQAGMFGLRVLPAMKSCADISVPVVIGLLRPVILLPVSAISGLSLDQLQAVIAHELAHIRRHDLLLNIVQRVIESLLFFHPAVWWVSRQIANEREQACDELVLAVGHGRAQYADALVRMAELSLQWSHPPVNALAATGSSTSAFKRRILKVLEIDTSPRIRPDRVAAVMASMVVLLALAMLLVRGGALASGTTGNQDSADSAEESSVDDERAAWRELDRLNVMIAGSGQPGWSVNLEQARERNDLNSVVKYQKLLDDIPTIADFWHVPAEAWPIIGRLKSLRQVRFVACDLQGQMGHLRELQSLRKFELRSGQMLPDDLAELGALTNLEVIDVNLSTWFKTEDEIAALLTKLTEEERRSCQQGSDFDRTKHRLSMVLTDAAIAKLRNLKQLKVLDLTHTFVSGKGVEALAHFPNLEQFTVDDWYLLSPASMRALGSLQNLRNFPKLPSGATNLIEPLAGLRNLEELRIAGGDLTDESLSHLKNLSSLKRLAILHSQLTDVGLLQLANLKQLEQLDIRGVDTVTTAGVQQLQEQLPACTIFRTDADYEASLAFKVEAIARSQPAEPQPEIKVGMTFDEVIRIKGRHYRPQPGIGAGQLFLYYDDLCVGIENHPIGEEGGKVFRIDPVGENVEFLLGSTPYADAAGESHLQIVARKYIGQVPGGIEVELLGTIRQLKSWDRLSLAPDGSPLPSLKPYLQKHGGDPFTNLRFGLREFEDQILYQVRGGDSPTVDVRASVPFGHHAGYYDADENRVEVLMGGGSLPKDPMTFTAKVADEPWGEWIQVGPTGKILNPEATRLRHASYYDKITIGHAGEHKENTTRSELKLNFPKGFFDSCRLHLQIVPKDGQELGSEHSMHYQPDSFRQSFHLRPDQIERFEFRLRPYRHLVKFENVSLDPDKRTEPKVSVEPISEFQVVGKDSGDTQPQPRIELIGLTYDKAEKTEAWQPNGQPMPLPEWAKSLPKILGGVLRQDSPSPLECLLFEFHGLRRTPSIHYHHSTITTGDNDVGSSGRPYRQAAIYISENSGEPDVRENPLKVSVSDEPWGPWRTITKQGRIVEPAKDDALYQAGYELISTQGFRPLERNPDRLGLVLRCPTSFSELYAFEIQSFEVMPLYPKSHREQAYSLPVGSVKTGTEANPITETEYDVDPDKIDHIRFRIRPYRHQFTFRNVNFAPSQNPANYTQFESVYKKLDHDLPKPERAAVIPPLFDIPVVDAQTNQPITNGKVTLRWSFDRSDLVTSVKPLRRIFDLQEELDLSDQGTFPIRVPAGMENARLQLQVSVRHPDYVIEQSFGYWPVTPEMATDAARAKEKLFNRGVIKLQRGYEVSGLVTDVLDQPVAGVRVYAAMQMPEYVNMPPHAVTDAQGRYKFRISSHDEYRLMFVPAERDKSSVKKDKPAEITAMAQVNLVAQSIPIREEYGEQPVVKLQSGTRIVGIVRDSAGKPLPNFVVQANGSDSIYMGFPEVMSRVVTDAEGRYELPGQQLPVDVRISQYNSLGGWSEPTALPADIYLPVFVTERWGKPLEGNEEVFDVDFAPVPTVNLRAKAYDAAGQPDDDADIALIGQVPVTGAGPEQRGPVWHRRFQKVPGEVGLYELKAPHGLLEARIDLTEEGLKQPAVNTWTRAVREGETVEGPRTDTKWVVLDRDDDSVIVGNAAVQAAQTTPPRTRIVSLKVENTPRRQILEQLAQKAGVGILIEEEALAATDFDLEEPMTLEFDEVPLWLAASDVCELTSVIQSGPVVMFRKNTMVVTTMESEAKRPIPSLPEWLVALQSQGVGGATDDDGQVTSVMISGKELTNEMLARLPELTHLKELTICPRGPATDDGLLALSKLHSLETLNISSSENLTDRADRILVHVKLLPNLKSVSFHESGVSDTGIAHLAENESVERISIYQDGEVSDRGIELIAGMSQLKGLALTQYVFLQDRPKMEYSDQALSRLGQLTQLEFLYLDGIDAPASLQLSPSLNALSLTGKQVDDAMAARIAACSDLKSLNLRSTAITDEGLRLIASGTKLTSLSLWETPITDAGMAHLTTHPLRSIELRSMRLGDATFNHLARIKTLSRLTIWAGGPPRVSLSTIGDTNDQSPIVNSMTVGGMRVLKDLPQLRSLSLLAFPSYEDYLALGELKQLRELSMMMSLTEEADLAALEAALPKTRISAGTGAGTVGGLGRSRK